MGRNMGKLFGRGGGDLVQGNGVFKTSGIKYIRSNSVTLHDGDQESNWR